MRKQLALAWPDRVLEQVA